MGWARSRGTHHSTSCSVARLVLLHRLFCSVQQNIVLGAISMPSRTEHALHYPHLLQLTRLNKTYPVGCVTIERNQDH